ncbi:MAG: methylated-DNA--[protein]-cysteine S-methyltransferase [Gammaproteobacteria bacterium]
MCASEHVAVMESPVGMLGISMAPNGLAAIDILPAGAAERRPITASVSHVVAALRRYFRDPQAPFDVPLRPSGTVFQRRVWALLQLIPVGQTVSYAALARRLPTSARAAGQACRANPIPIIVPCHRVVAVRGLGGFMGGSPAYLEVKRWLLQHEAQAWSPAPLGVAR